MHMCNNTSFTEEILKITSSKKFVIHILICHVIFITFLTFNIYVSIIGFGLSQCIALIFRIFLIYHNFVTILTVYVFVKFIKTGLEKSNNYLSEQLEKSGIRRRKINLTIEIKLQKFDNEKICSGIRRTTQFYENFVQQMPLFNKLFGWQLLFLVLSFFMGLINSINIVIYFCVSDTFQVDLRVQVILTHLFWTLWQLIIGGLAVVMCTETEKSGNICLNALTNLPYSKENDRLKEELVLLNCMVNQMIPTFSAAGLFSINYSLLLSIIGSITSYVIVLIQFNKI